MMKKGPLTIIFCLLILLFILSSCTNPAIMNLFPNLEGYWRFEASPFMFGAGFIHIIQNNDQITMRSITESQEITENTYKLTNPGLVSTRERYFQNGPQLLSGETLPEGTYTTISKQVADITENQINIFQEFDYVVHEGVEKCYDQADLLNRSYTRALKPESIDKWLEHYSPRLEVQTTFKEFTAGETYAITFDIIPDEELPNLSTEGRITLTCNQKTFTLTVDRINWFNLYSLINDEELIFVLMKGTHADFSFLAACHNNNNNQVFEGPAYVDETEIGTVIF